MSYRHSDAVREIPSEKFDGFTQRFLLIELAHLADNFGVLRLPQTEVAAMVLMSPRTIARELKGLEAKGFIAKLRHGQYKVNVFAAQTSAEAKAEPAKAVANSEEEEPEPTGFEGWWLENADRIEFEGDIDVILFPMEDVPDEAIQYVAEGKLKRRRDMTIYNGVMCNVYERV